MKLYFSYDGHPHSISLACGQQKNPLLHRMQRGRYGRSQPGLARR